MSSPRTAVPPETHPASPPIPPPDPARRAAIVWAPVVVLVAGGAGMGVARLAAPVARSRYFPWIVGRGLGLAAFAALSALVCLGLWARHPWRTRVKVLHPETALRLHSALAAATVVLVTGHVVSLAMDSYAGVGWVGVLLPGAATYRPIPVALGVACMWVLVAIAASARLGARLVRWTWLPLHHLALPMFAAALMHGLLAGTDAPSLRTVYGAIGVFVVLLWLSRRLAHQPVRVPEPT